MIAGHRDRFVGGLGAPYGPAAAGQPAASSSPVRAAGILGISPDCVIATHRRARESRAPPRPISQVI